MPDQGRDDAFETELRSLVTAGHRLEAVKRYRERMKTSLKDAAEAVEALARQEGITQRQSDSVEWDVISLLERGQKIQAVKFYRERTGSSLKEAKDAIERIAAEHSISTPGGAGCVSMIALGVVLLLCMVIAAIRC